MDFQTYLNETKRTESPGFYKKNVSVNMLHAIIGICTEASELLVAMGRSDLVNVKEELGDMFWYIGLLCRDLCITDLVFHAEPEIEEEGIVALSGRLLDMVKKGLFYNKPLDPVVVEDVLQIMVCKMCNIIYVYEWKIEDVWKENVDKLRKRYPHKFTTDLADKRLDKE